MAETPLSLSIQYEKMLQKRQKQIRAKINRLFNQLIDDVSPLASIQKLPKGVFRLDKLNTLNDRVDKAISKLVSQVESEVVNGINGSWQLSNAKNKDIADIRLDKSKIPTDKKTFFYDTNADALKEFTKRKINGLDLSERIYKAGEQMKAELEAGIGLGISQGQDAESLGRDLRQYLQDPDRLFRRVRSAKGILKLSKNAKAFHPGQGVYRSAAKNIQRLTRTETNMAYRSADMVKYQQMPFILGYEVRLSASHPKFDICDDMKGNYPVDFKFIGWHPQCLCFVVPILMNTEQFLQYQQMVLAGTDSPANVAKITNRVMTIPESATGWINKNQSRVQKWSKLPFWWQQNKDFVPKGN